MSICFNVFNASHSKLLLPRELLERQKASPLLDLGYTTYLSPFPYCYSEANS